MATCHNLYSIAAGFVCSRLESPEWESEKDARDVWTWWCTNFELVKYRKTPSLSGNVGTVTKVKNSIVASFGLELLNNYSVRGVCGNFSGHLSEVCMSFLSSNALSKHTLTHATKSWQLSGEGWAMAGTMCVQYTLPQAAWNLKDFQRLANVTLVGHFHPTQ